MASNRTWTQRDYAEAMRHVVTPTDVRALAAEVREISKQAEEPGDRIRAAEWLIIHTKGRPGTAAPAVDPLELPRVQDAASALAAYQALTDAVSKGECCADSAAVYRALIGDAAKIALADSAVSLLAAGGQPEFLLSDEVPIEEQLPAMEAFLRAQMALRKAADAYAKGPAPDAEAAPEAPTPSAT